jgi:hypothetical protein
MPATNADRELVISRVFARVLFLAHSQPRYVSSWFGQQHLRMGYERGAGSEMGQLAALAARS